ncbi:MAG TPA: hypothetical protein VN065_07450, partial [Bradyrhizobium sp.]|nr:hypothetical protein [Bradyrhizobium sp.]
MEESLFDDHDQCKLWNLAAIDQGIPDIAVPHDHGPAGDAQRFALTGNEDDQADAGILQHIVERIHAPVAAAIRNGKRGVIEASDEPGAIALRREIHQAERIGRTHDDEGGRRDKVLTTAIEPAQNPAGEPFVGGADN